MPFVLLYLVVEIVALVALASWIGVGYTLLVLLAGSVVGLWLARREGLRAVRAMAEAAPDVRELGLEPEPVRVTVRCTTNWELLT